MGTVAEEILAKGESVRQLRGDSQRPLKSTPESPIEIPVESKIGRMPPLEGEVYSPLRPPMGGEERWHHERQRFSSFHEKRFALQ